MRRTFISRFFLIVCLFLTAVLSAQEAGAFRIADVTYDIKGSTRKLPLSQAVKIDTKKVFLDQTSLDAYLADIQLQLSNQRVLQSVSLETSVGEKDDKGITPVHLTVHTVDTWNIIALPYPKFDSNSGFQFKFKLKNYNFFGSMQPLSGDLIYEVDNNGDSQISSNFSFNIPFEFGGYVLTWKNDFSATFPQSEIPQYEIGTGLSIDVPIPVADKIVFSLDQNLIINDRRDVDQPNGDTWSVLYEDDPCYFNEVFSIGVPFTLFKTSDAGDLVWQPSTSADANFAPGGMHDSDLRGTTLSAGHSLSFGRVNWHGNFRHGATVSLSNNYSYNLETSNEVTPSVSGTATGFYSLSDRIGINSRLYGFANLNGEVSSNVGEPIRGILNNRIDTDSGISLNLDLPVKVLDVDFVEITGVPWTKYISFDMHLSPFFDMMLVHDTVHNRYYSVKDGWYGGGLEVLIFPKKMRSIFARVSVGLDLGDMAQNGWKYRPNAERDGEATKELFLGLGLAY